VTTQPGFARNRTPGLWFDETTSTLLAGYLLTTLGNPTKAVTEPDLVEPAITAEQIFHGTDLTTLLGPTIHQLADLEPTTLAVMHGASFRGNGAAQLRALADSYADVAAG